MQENSIIAQLTPKQKALISIYQEKWRKIILSTEPINREKAAEAIKTAYNLIGEDEPDVIFFDSPYEASKHLLLFKEPYSNLRYDDLLTRLIIDVCNTEENYPQLSLKSQVDDELWDKITNFDEIILQAVAEQLKANYDETIFISAEFEERPLLSINIDGLNFAWEADFLISEMKFESNVGLNLFLNIIKNCGWINAYQEACLICDRPTKLSFDSQNRLHAEGEPAIEYVDGFKVYVDKGIILYE